MKIPYAFLRCSGSWRLMAATAWLVGLTPFGVARTADSLPDAESKPFVLFMGTDIDVELGKQAHRVKNVVGDAFIIVVDQKPVEVPMNRGPIGMKVSPQLKLSDKTAVVKELKFERAYTPQNDPNRKWAARQSGSAGQVLVGNSAGVMATAQMGAQQAAIRGAALAGPSGTTFGSDNSVASTTNAFNAASSQAGSDFNSAGYAAQQLQEELGKELFDAMLVTCEVSAPRALHDPYLVVITHYREKDQPSGAAKSWIFAKALDRLDETPLKVRILQGGFPPGFEVVRQELHLYGAGRELGTNVAEKNVTLTRDEAHQYIVIDHLVTHKKDTLPPSLALGVSRNDFYPHYGSEQVQQVIYVKVDKDGLPGGAFRNERCTEPSGDDYLEKLVSRTRFKPAIKAGKPTDGIATLKIVDLAL
jgi:hypothetical protein